jgi:hypothetical protein
MDSYKPTSRAPLKNSDYYLSEESTTYGSHSPYPPSVTSSDSETDSNITHTLSEVHHLHASIATISERRLREIMVRLVNRNPGFKHAVAKELSPYTPSASPIRRKPRKSGRPGSSDTMIPERKCAKCGKYVRYAKGRTYLPHEKCAFHPGKTIWLALGADPQVNP